MVGGLLMWAPLGSDIAVVASGSGMHKQDALGQMIE